MKPKETLDTHATSVFRMLALGFILAHAPAMAQDQTSPDQSDAEAEAVMEEVIVSGTRRALQNSIDIKRSAPGIVDAMSMGDIGDIPSLSVGEAIEQITGASGHRFKGSVSGISIRGLGPFLSLQTFNGRQGTTAAASRDMNYQVFPSELTKSITIYKSQQADLIEGGTAGTIDIGTVRPLEYGRQSISVNMRGLYNDYADRSDNGDPWGYRGSVSYIDQWEMPNGNDIGLAVGYSRWDSGNPEEMFSTSSSWKICDSEIDRGRSRCSEYDQKDQAEDLEDGVVKDSLYFIPHSYYWRLNNDEVEVRDAVIGAFQWRSENMDLTLDGFWSDKYYEDDRHDFIIDDTRDEHYNVVNDGYQLLSYTGVSRVRNDGELYRRDETLKGIGLDYGWRINDRWEVRMDLSNNNHTRDRERRYVRTRLSTYIMYDMELTGTLPSITFVDGFTQSPAGTTIHDNFDPNDLSLYDNMSDFRLRNRQTNRETDAWGVKFDAIYRPEPGGFFESINFGVREGKYQRITNNEDDRHWRVRDGNFLDEYWDGGYDGIEEDLFEQMIAECSYDPFPNSKFMNGADGTNIGGSWATFDTLCATRLLTNGENALLAPDRTLNERDIDVAEYTTAGYVMANFYSENSPMPIWGNFGVRVVKTDVESRGLRTGYATEQDPDTGLWRVIELDDYDPIRFDESNTEWLPSANVNFEMSDTFMIRAALYRAMSRYNIEFMGAGRSFGSIDDEFEYETRDAALQDQLSQASGGNPAIEPFMSWNGDVSFEWYLSDDTAFSVALYYKKFEAEVFPAIVPETIEIDGVDVIVDTTKNVLLDNTSDLWGFEVTASHVFSNLPAPFDGLGFKASWNHSDTDFETQDPIFGDQLQDDGTILPGMNLLVPASIYGQSDDIANLQLFWDIGNLDLALFWKYRSEYFQPNDGDPRVNRWFDDYLYMDFSATYRFNSVWKTRLSVQNITDEPQLGDRGLRDGSPTLWNATGTRYELGVTATWD
jgi:TonB-dependent receptor